MGPSIHQAEDFYDIACPYETHFYCLELYRSYRYYTGPGNSATIERSDNPGLPTVCPRLDKVASVNP